MGAEYDWLSKTATLNFCTLFNNNNNNNNNNNGLFTASGKATFKGKVMLVPVRINEYWSASSNTLDHINWSWCGYVLKTPWITLQRRVPGCTKNWAKEVSFRVLNFKTTGKTRKMSQRYFCPAEYTIKTKPKTNPKILNLGFRFRVRVSFWLVLVVSLAHFSGRTRYYLVHSKF